MNIRLIFAITAGVALLGMGTKLLTGQDTDLKINVVKGEKPSIAVPDLRGSGDAQRVMDPFNQTLWDELAGSGALTMRAKSFYPLEVPQQPSDFKPPTASAPARRGEAPRPVRNGP